MKKIFKKPVWLLSLCMAVVVVFSLLANLVNTSAYSVSVENIKFKTKSDEVALSVVEDNFIASNYMGINIHEYEGEMEALLYTPKSCENKKCPVIVTTHGYLNSKEMQDAPAIELSKRGYIVVALDMYDHGGSTWDTPGTFAFFPTSLWDAVKWVYDQEFTLKDENGNAMVAVSGHSMGGFSTEMAVYIDERNYKTTAANADPEVAATAHRKIAVSLSVGADYRYTSFFDPYVVPMSFMNAFSTRSSGMIIGHFDEFFGDGHYLFDMTGDTVVYKDYLETEEGQYFLDGGLTAAAGKEYEVNKFYDNMGGQRVIYTPYETHPWNHFSTETTGYMIDFYDEAFEYQLTKAGLVDAFEPVEKNGQTWWLKEAFEFVAMLGLFTAIIPAFALLLKVPCFAKVKTNEETLPVEKEMSKGKKIALVVVALLTSLIPAYYFPSIIGQSASKLSLFSGLADDIISIAILLTIGAWVVYFAYRMTKGDENKEKAKNAAWDVTKGALAVSGAALVLRFFAVNPDIISSGYYYNTDTVTAVGFWAVLSAAVSLVVLTTVHFFTRKKDGATIKSYGLSANIKQVLLALVLSVILFVGVYAVVFLVEWLLNTDFRLWVYAIKSFDTIHFTTFLKYIPMYFVFYLVNSIVVVANTKDVKGWKGYLYAIILNAGGLILFTAYQYGKLFVTGRAYYPGLALHAIWLFGLIPTLIVAAIIAKKFYEKTNNVWVSAFFNTFLFTMIAVANTAVFALSL